MVAGSLHSLLGLLHLHPRPFSSLHASFSSLSCFFFLAYPLSIALTGIDIRVELSLVVADWHFPYEYYPCYYLITMERLWMDGFSHHINQTLNHTVNMFFLSLSLSPSLSLSSHHYTSFSFVLILRSTFAVTVSYVENCLLYIVCRSLQELIDDCSLHLSCRISFYAAYLITTVTQIPVLRQSIGSIPREILHSEANCP